MDALPPTANGKLDTSALLTMHEPLARKDSGFLAPSTESQRTIAGVWRDVLGVDSIIKTAVVGAMTAFILSTSPRTSGGEQFQ